MKPDSSRPQARIAAGLDAVAIVPPSGAVEKLAAHLALVTEWNEACGLTAVRDADGMILRHVLDSAAALPFLRGRWMLDAGSGAGFPGIVLALLAPDTTWVLVESNGKKAGFLDHVLRRLGLGARVELYAGRLESYPGAPDFDTVTVRALANLARIGEWCEDLLAPGGRLLAFKGRLREIERECAGLDANWRVAIEALRVPGLAAERHIVILERGS
ncbi:MAG TPA: 16S rRNA (guanine(527)-N(7))-methyltransferase RsmG [Gammaproteobacteria bacterium]|nr:16S rRNA (guanine(527)-N(7))-methyltransferase RsmG [Gammaproteobacteria bacterium]